jgi:hypothetical protein
VVFHLPRRWWRVPASWCSGDGGGSRRHGAAGSRRQARDDGFAQDGGVVWRHGAVDGSPSKINALILPKDGSAEDGVSEFSSVCNGVRLVFATLVCVSNSLLGVLVRPPVI